MQDLDELIDKFKPEASKAIREFEEFVLVNFDHFDLDGDGYLTKDELEVALVEQERTVREIGFLNFLLVRIREIAASHDEGEDRSDGISKLDVQEYFSKL